MRYNVAQLLKEPIGALRKHQVNMEIRDLDADLSPCRPLVGTVILMRTNHGILATGVLETILKGACRRCLEPCDLEAKLILEEEFFSSNRRADMPGDEPIGDDQDQALLIDDRNVLDLSEVVRQGLWLSRPMEALCREECAGLCPECGGNRNLDECHCDNTDMDPRWAALQVLLSDAPDLNEGSD